jgi:hypothetical protein
MNRPTPETDAAWACFKGYMEPLQDVKDLSRKLERERDEAREVLRQIWQSGDAFLPHVDQETINRWRKAAGWEETK